MYCSEATVMKRRKLNATISQHWYSSSTAAVPLATLVQSGRQHQILRIGLVKTTYQKKGESSRLACNNHELKRSVGTDELPPVTIRLPTADEACREDMLSCRVLVNWHVCKCPYCPRQCVLLPLPKQVTKPTKQEIIEMQDIIELV